MLSVKNDIVYTETNLYDKSIWDDGPWRSEPDRVAWVDPITGLNCLARRVDRGNWCGYVAVPKKHNYFGVEYDEIPFNDNYWPHGGLTFSDECHGDPQTGICHPSEGKDDVWWFGFDTAHYNDLTPNPAGEITDPEVRLKFNSSLWTGRKYRNLDYIKNECTLLALRLKQLGKIRMGGRVKAHLRALTKIKELKHKLFFRDLETANGDIKKLGELSELRNKVEKNGYKALRRLFQTVVRRQELQNEV